MKCKFNDCGWCYCQSGRSNDDCGQCNHHEACDEYLIQLDEGVEMSELVEVKTTELIGSALDWAAAKAQNFECGLINRERGILGCNADDGSQYVIGKIKHETVAECLHAKYYRPSSDWAQGGPLLDKYNVWLSDDEGEAVASCFPHRNELIHVGATLLVATCRAIVQSQLGDYVGVPVELMQ